MDDTMSGMMIEELDVLVMAAGMGTRMGGAERKQWLSLCGRPLFMYTVERILSFGVTSCIVVVHPDDLLRVEEELRTKQWENVRVTAGGDDRQVSVHYGLQFATRKYVAVHDGARPFLTQEDFLAVIAKAAITGAATLAHPVYDTIKRGDEHLLVAEHVDRSKLWAVQTPQVFLRTWLNTAHEMAKERGDRGTDDTVLVEHIGKPVALVRGSKWNVKLTDAEDIVYMRMWEAQTCGLD